MLPPPYHNRSRLLAVLLLVLCGLPAAAHGPADYAALYKEASKSVVDVWEDFGDLGTGVIISPEGHVLTNAHVIYDYDIDEVISPAYVNLYDGSTEKVEVIGYDHHYDIALLKIDTDRPLPVAKIGDSSKLQIGEAVLAIGHPHGFYFSLSTGVISSVDRYLPGPNREAAAGCLVPWIQTDAVINGGNSGGPLLNDEGEVIGIISWSQSLGYDDSGLNFAMPINDAMDIQEVLRDWGSVPWGILGVYVDEQIAVDSAGNEVKGLRVNQVNRDSGAEEAGIMVGDVIIEYDEQPYFDGYFVCVPEGEEIEIKLIREGKELALQVTLSAIEEDGFLL